jgi:hypothetical protein
MICREAGVALPWVYQVTNFLFNNALVMTLASLFPLVLLEWRWNRWPQFRRLTLGSAVFVLNAAVMAMFALMVVFALLAAPQLMKAG